MRVGGRARVPNLEEFEEPVKSYSDSGLILVKCSLAKLGDDFKTLLFEILIKTKNGGQSKSAHGFKAGTIHQT